MSYLIGVDIGTQGTKTNLYNEKGQIVSYGFESSNLINENGTIYQDPDEIFFSVINTIKEVINKSGVDGSDVAGLAMDSQMAGIMGIDKDFNAVTYYDSWLDNNCKKYIDIIKHECRDTVVKITGAPISNTHGPKILWWKNEKPDIYKKIDKFVLPGVYVAGRMAGLKSDKAVMDYTNIHFSGFADNKNMIWSKTLLDAFDVDEGKMPKIASPFDILGYVNRETANLTGLKQGMPIMVGCGDTAANCFGAGIVKPGQAFDVAGTASVFACCVDEFKPDVKNGVLFQMRSVVEGNFTPLAYIGGGGLCLRWFKENFTGGQNVSYDTLEAEAKLISPGSEGLTFIPHFEGRVCPSDQSLKGSFTSLGWNHTRAHMYRSIMEGIAYEYKFYYETMKIIGLDKGIDNIFGVGGGANSMLFNSIKADILQVPYTPLKVRECATLGCAVIAGVGVGIYSDAIETVTKMNSKEKIVLPNKKNYVSYEKGYRVYKRTLDELSNMYKKVAINE